MLVGSQGREKAHREKGHCSVVGCFGEPKEGRKKRGKLTACILGGKRRRMLGSEKARDLSQNDGRKEGGEETWTTRRNKRNAFGKGKE